MKTLYFAIGAVALSACASDPFPAMRSQLESFKGQPARALIERLGPADETNKDGNARTYVWFRVNKSGPEFQEDFVACTIKAYADKDDRITGFFYTGNNSGCGRYERKLDKTSGAPGSASGP